MKKVIRAKWQLLARQILWQFGGIKMNRLRQYHFRTLRKCFLPNTFHPHAIPIQNTCYIKSDSRISSSYAGLHDALDAANTPQEIFDKINLTACVDTSVLVKILEALCSVTIEKVQLFPWACVDSLMMLYVQSSREKTCSGMILNSIQVPAFHELCNNLLMNISYLTNEELARVGNALLWLQVSPENPLFSNLLMQCIERYYTFSIANLSMLSSVSTRLNRPGFHINGLITQAFYEHDLGSIDLTGETYKQVAELVSNLSYFWSPEFLHHITSSFAKVLSSPDCGVAPSSSIQYLEALCRFAPRLSVKTIKVIVDHLHDNVESLSAWQMSRVMIFVNQINCNQFIVEDIERRAQCMIQSHNLTPVDVTSIINIMEYVNYPGDTFKTLEQLLLQTLQDCDVILLKALSNKQFLISSRNTELKTKFAEVVIEQLPNLVNTPSCFLDVISLLTRMKYQGPQLRILTNLLLQLIQTNRYGNQQNHMVIIAQYFLKQASSTHHMPSIVLDRLLAFLPQYQIKELNRLNTSMSLLQSSGTPLYVIDQIDFARSRLRRQTIAKLSDDIDSLHSLNATVKSLSKGFGRYKSIVPSRKCAELYQKLIVRLDCSSIKSTNDCIRYLRLYVPEALEVLVDFANENSQYVDINQVSNILHTVSLLNHVPQGIDNLQDVFVQLCSKRIAEPHTIPVILVGVLSLATMELFCEQLITTIFSTDFLQRFDRYCEEACPSRERQILRMQMKNLNRSVVLTCPHLDVPWFHDRLCREDDDIKITSRLKYIGDISSKLRATLKSGLLSVLGGEAYFADRNISSEYFHEIDFLCILNSRKTPLEVKKYKHDASQTRVAILLLNQQDYCANVHHLTGPTVAKLRELEILGYKVVPIPYFELDEITHGWSKSLDTYLLEKIF